MTHILTLKNVTVFVNNVGSDLSRIPETRLTGSRPMEETILDCFRKTGIDLPELHECDCSRKKTNNDELWYNYAAFSKKVPEKEVWSGKPAEEYTLLESRFRYQREIYRKGAIAFSVMEQKEPVFDKSGNGFVLAQPADSEELHIHAYDAEGNQSIVPLEHTVTLAYNRDRETGLYECKFYVNALFWKAGHTVWNHKRVIQIFDIDYDPELRENLGLAEMMERSPLFRTMKDYEIDGRKVTEFDVPFLIVPRKDENYVREHTRTLMEEFLKSSKRRSNHP